MRPRRSALPVVLPVILASVLAVAGCKSTSSASQPSSGSDGRAVSPLANQDGLGPGLAAIASADERTRARDLITKVPTGATGSKTGYSRDKFGDAWTDSAAGDPLAGNGCDTRDDVLARDGQNLAYTQGSHCVIASMTLFNPYKSQTITWTKAKATEVQIDHVVPLSYAWQMGADRWAEDKRIQLANDPLNLLAVDGSDNASKGDSGPGEWKPQKSFQCKLSGISSRDQLQSDASAKGGLEDSEHTGRRDGSA